MEPENITVCSDARILCDSAFCQAGASKSWAAGTQLPSIQRALALASGGGLPARLCRRFPIRVGGLRFLAVLLPDFGFGHLGLRRRRMLGRGRSSLGRSSLGRLLGRLPGGLPGGLRPALAVVLAGFLPAFSLDDLRLRSR